MNKILFFYFNIIAIIGICVLFITNILNAVFPMMGRTALQLAMNGSYNSGDYIADFTVVNRFAILLIVVGVILSIILYIKGMILSASKEDSR